MDARRHFITGKFTPHARRLSDAEYGRVLDNVVIACVDCVLVCDGKMLVGKRTRQPQPDWWVVGGRMQPGENFQTAAARHCLRELGVEISPHRFSYLNTTSQVWGRRAQPPQNNGCHTIAVTMIAVLAADEKKSLKHNDEYNTLQWIHRATLPQPPAIIPY